MKITVQVERVGDWWSISSRDVRGLHSQARSLTHVADMAVDAARLLGIEVDDVVVEVSAHADDVAELRAAYRAAEEAQSVAAAMSRRLAKQIRSEGISVRDAAVIMRVSPQRISQLTA